MKQYELGIWMPNSEHSDEDVVDVSARLIQRNKFSGFIRS
jgi:hypothetical protein